MPELPPPLPPAERTVGQLVAETIRLYGDRFWRALPLGIPLAGATQLGLGRGIDIQIVILCLSAPVFSAAYVYAIQLALSLSPPRSVLVRAWWVGMLVWIPRRSCSGPSCSRASPGSPSGASPSPSSCARAAAPARPSAAAGGWRPPTTSTHSARSAPCCSSSSSRPA